MTKLTLEYVAVERLKPNPSNPNDMTDLEFNALCESIEEEGFIDPIEAVFDESDQMFQIVGGEHRWQAAKILGMTEVPVTPLDPAVWDQDRQDWNLVKQNILHGSLNPGKFAALYERMVEKYDAEVLQTLMGFTSEDGFRRVYQEVRDALPEDLQKALDDAQDEIKTIDDLSSVLNRLFREFGDTLPSNVMVFSWGGQQVLWVRCTPELWRTVDGMAKRASTDGLDMAKMLQEALADG